MSPDGAAWLEIYTSPADQEQIDHAKPTSEFAPDRFAARDRADSKRSSDSPNGNLTGTGAAIIYVPITRGIRSEDGAHLSGGCTNRIASYLESGAGFRVPLGTDTKVKLAC